MVNSHVIVAFIFGILVGGVLFRLSFPFRRNNGVMFITRENDELQYVLQLEEEPSDLIKKRYIMFKVSNKPH